MAEREATSRGSQRITAVSESSGPSVTTVSYRPSPSSDLSGSEFQGVPGYIVQEDSHGSPRSPARGMKELYWRPEYGGNTRHDFHPMWYDIVVYLRPLIQATLSLLGVGCHRGTEDLVILSFSIIFSIIYCKSFQDFELKYIELKTSLPFVMAKERPFK